MKKFIALFTVLALLVVTSTANATRNRIVLANFVPAIAVTNIVSAPVAVQFAAVNSCHAQVAAVDTCGGHQVAFANQFAVAATPVVAVQQSFAAVQVATPIVVQQQFAVVRVRNVAVVRNRFLGARRVVVRRGLFGRAIVRVRGRGR